MASGEDSSTVVCAFSRDILVPGLFAIREGQSMVFRAGFNVYQTVTQSRMAWGYAETGEVAIPAPVVEVEIE